MFPYQVIVSSNRFGGHLAPYQQWWSKVASGHQKWFSFGNHSREERVNGTVYTSGEDSLAELTVALEDTPMHTSTIRTSGNGSHDSRLAWLLDLVSGAQDSFAGSRVSCSGIWKRGSGGSGTRTADARSL